MSCRTSSGGHWGGRTYVLLAGCWQLHKGEGLIKHGPEGSPTLSCLASLSWCALRGCSSRSQHSREQQMQSCDQAAGAHFRLLLRAPLRFQPSLVCQHLHTDTLHSQRNCDRCSLGLCVTLHWPGPCAAQPSTGALQHNSALAKCDHAHYPHPMPCLAAWFIARTSLSLNLKVKSILSA